MNLKPLGDRVLLKKIKQETKTVSGIIISSNNNVKNLYEVVDFGVGEKIEELKKQGLNIKDKVLFNNISNIEFDDFGNIFIIVKAEDIEAIVKD